MKYIFTLLLPFYFSALVNAQSGEMEFTSSGEFIVPDDVSSVFIEVIGAGGSGGYNGTGGGGGGAYASGNYTVTPGTTMTITIGLAGMGEDIGTTSVDGFVMATGGRNGVSVPNPEIGGGGLGGVAYGGNIVNYAGGTGGGGYYTYFGGGGGGAAGPDGAGGDGGNTIAWTGICNTPGGDAGISGGLPAGDGGKGAGFTDDFCVDTNPAGTGENYGGGGGGGNGNGGGPGAGSNGYCRISWCSVDVSTSLSGETITAITADANYQWIDCSTGNEIAGETSQDFTATENGSFAVIINDGFCSDTSDCVAITTIIEQSIENSNNNYAVVNPFNDKIELSGIQGNEFFMLVNLKGQIIWSGGLIGTENFSALPEAVYFLKIQNENGIEVLQLLKE